MVSRRNFVRGAAALAAMPFLPSSVFGASLYGEDRFDLAATGLGVENFPAQPWLTDVRFVGAQHIENFFVNGVKQNGLYWYRLDYDMLGGPDNAANGGRRKRCFVVHKSLTQQTVPLMFVGLPASNGFEGADGAYDLISPPTADQQSQWPLHIVNDHSVFACLIDGPGFGEYPYPGFYAPTAMHSIVDDICGINAARWFLATVPHFLMNTGTPGGGRSWEPMLSTFIGGLSWGACRASWLATALKDCTGAYLSGTHLSKTDFDPVPAMQPSFAPPQWAANFDYPDMIKASPAKKYRIAYGGETDTGYGPYLPEVAARLDGIVAHDPARFSKHLDYVGHTMDLADIRSFFASYFQGTGSYAADMRWQVPPL